MDVNLDTMAGSPLPEFGGALPRRAEACRPRELFCSLVVDAEDNVAFVECAFEFVTSMLRKASRSDVPSAEPMAYLEEQITSALRSLEPARVGAYAREDALRVAREFAPVGLTDGAWLRGAMLANMIETEVGLSLLKQMMIRFGDPGSGEAYSQRYASLLRSVGVAPDEMTRWQWSGESACSEASYEHALLGVGLGLFPSTFALETVGFNLWMATVGPCPLLERVAPALRPSGASLRYVDELDRTELAKLARQAVQHALSEFADLAALARISRGFEAAHQSYQRWQRSVEGEATALAGVYTAPAEAKALEAFAFARYGKLSNATLYHTFANSDCHPASRIFARVLVGGILGKLGAVMDSDARLNCTTPPDYSERMLAELVAEQHAKNVRSRALVTETSLPEDGLSDPSKDIQAIFDGCWLQGFADVQRANFEEYGWLFRIYASEHGDGEMAYNHSRIFRRAFAGLGDDVLLPKTDPRLYQLFDVGPGALATLAASLNTRRFMPELLGMNLGIEATGVAGIYLERWRRARGKGAKWKALAFRLHNSIDNYADGHTKWSLSAVQSFMQRVRDGSPADVQPQWRRIWRLWRLQDILTHGSPGERAALAEQFNLTSLAPT
jgi:hypothetical protein